MRFLILIIIFFSVMSCSNEPKIIVTKDYIVNKNWNDTNNSILIEKMRLKTDSFIDVFSSEFMRVPNNWNITNKLEVDSSFTYGYHGLNIDTKKVKLKDTVFFNDKNRFLWYDNSFKKNNKTDVIGSLKNDTWYKFSNLRMGAYFVYIYIDSRGLIHRFNVNLSNF